MLNHLFINGLNLLYKEKACWIAAKVKCSVHKRCLPYEVRTVAAERRLLEEPRCEFVVFHFMHVFLPQSTFAGEPVPNPSWVTIM